MRMPRVRFTVRVALLGVALAGSSMWIARLVGLSRQYRERADGYRVRMRFAFLDDPTWAGRANGPAEAAGRPLATGGRLPRPREGAEARRYAEGVFPLPRYTAPSSALRSYYRDMIEKYERAARYPWLPVAPDPPEPE
jgi:hypothetical protein